MDFWEVYNAEADNRLAQREEQPEDTMFWDDNSGKPLGPKLVRFAREEEMEQEPRSLRKGAVSRSSQQRNEVDHHKVGGHQQGR